MVRSFGSNPRRTVKFQPDPGLQLPATLAAVRGVFTFSWRGAGALVPRRGPRRLNNKRGAAKRQEDRTMSKGPGPGGSAASSAPPAATAQVLQAQPEKPQHYTYVEPPPRRARTPDVSGQRESRAQGEREAASPSPLSSVPAQTGSNLLGPVPTASNCHQPLVGLWGGKPSPAASGEGGSSRRRVHTSQAWPSRPNWFSGHKTTVPGTLGGDKKSKTRPGCVPKGPALERPMNDH